jgi:S-adenosylmethionine decarboxylase
MKQIKNLLVAGVLFFGSSALLAEEAQVPYEFYGKHFMASYLDCDQEAILDNKRLQEVLLEAARACGAEVLNSSSYEFQPTGLTQVVLLSESHASIHTYPEHQSCFVDLFTCGHRCDWKAFDEVMQNYLKPKNPQTQVIIRD